MVGNNKEKWPVEMRIERLAKNYKDKKEKTLMRERREKWVFI